MNTHYRFRTITDQDSVPNFATIFGSSRALRWLLPLLATVTVAVVVMSLHELRSRDGQAVRGSATAHAVLITPEEQAFINRVRHAQVVSVGGRVAIKPATAGLLIGPEERAFIDGLQRARAASVGRSVAIATSRTQPLIGPEEKAFIDRINARIASVYRPHLGSRVVRRF